MVNLPFKDLIGQTGHRDSHPLPRGYLGEVFFQKMLAVANTVRLSTMVISTAPASSDDCPKVTSRSAMVPAIGALIVMVPSALAVATKLLQPSLVGL